MTAGNPAICDIVDGHRPPLECNRPRRNRVVVLIDDDEAAGLAIHAVGIAYHRLQCFDSHLADVIRLKFRDR